MGYCTYCRKRIKTEGIKFINIPKCEKKRKLWEESLGCSFGLHSKICQSHFKPTDWKPLTNKGRELKRRHLLPDAIPVKGPYPKPDPEPETIREGFTNTSTQTESNIINHNLYIENKSQKREIRELKNEIDDLRQQLKETDQLQKSLSYIFTKTQIKILKNDGKRSEFNSEDMKEAICLHATGPSTYKYLYKKGFPLPAPSTLYRRLALLEKETGTPFPVLDENKPEDSDKACQRETDD